jgi:hypothetical protein
MRRRRRMMDVDIWMMGILLGCLVVIMMIRK